MCFKYFTGGRPANAKIHSPAAGGKSTRSNHPLFCRATPCKCGGAVAGGSIIQDPPHPGRSFCRLSRTPEAVVRGLRGQSPDQSIKRPTCTRGFEAAMNQPKGRERRDSINKGRMRDNALADKEIGQFSMKIVIGGSAGAAGLPWCSVRVDGPWARRAPALKRRASGPVTALRYARPSCCCTLRDWLVRRRHSRQQHRRACWNMVTRTAPGGRNAHPMFRVANDDHHNKRKRLSLAAVVPISSRFDRRLGPQSAPVSPPSTLWRRAALDARHHRHTRR